MVLHTNTACGGLLSTSRAAGYIFSCSSGSFSPVLGSPVQISVDLGGQTCGALQEKTSLELLVQERRAAGTSATA